MVLEDGFVVEPLGELRLGLHVETIVDAVVVNVMAEARDEQCEHVERVQRLHLHGAASATATTSFAVRYFCVDHGRTS